MARTAREEEAPLLEEAQPEKKSFLGLFYMSLSALAFSSMSCSVKLLSAKFSPSIPSWEIVFFRSIFQLFFSLIYLASHRLNPFGPSEFRWLLLLRGFFGALGNAGFFYGITQLSLGDATVLFFTNPILTVLFAWIFLGEYLSYLDVMVSLLCFSGVVLVARPSFLFGNHAQMPHALQASLITLFGAVMGASAYVTVRKIGTRASFMTSVFSFGLVSSLLSPIALYCTQHAQMRMPASWQEWALLWSTGVFAFGGQCLLNRGLQIERAGPATLMRNLDVVFAFLLDFWIVGESPNGFSIAGAIIIVFASIVLALGKML